MIIRLRMAFLAAALAAASAAGVTIIGSGAHHPAPHVLYHAAGPAPNVLYHI